MSSFRASFGSCHAAACVCVALMTSACATSGYQARSPCLLHLQHVDGAPHLAHNGKVTPLGRSGDGLVAQTAGVPVAHRFATASADAARTATILNVSSIAAFALAPIPLLVDGGGNTQAEFKTGQLLSGSLFALGAGLLAGTLIQRSRTTALRQDAIASFNDEAVRGGRCR